MSQLLLTISIALTLACVFPYIRDIINGSTKPNLVSWITWTILTTVATIAEWSAGSHTAAFFTGSAAVETLIIVVLGLRHGYVKYSFFDVVCQASAIIGFILWWVFNSPAIAVIAAVIIDFIGTAPTIRHAWLNPEEETLSTFALAAGGGVFALLALTEYSWSSVPYLLYIAVINTITVLAILFSVNRQSANRA